MPRLVHLGDDLMLLEVAPSQWSTCTMETVKQLLPPGQLDIAVSGVKTAVLAASSRTIDQTATAHFGPTCSYRTEELGPNSFQVWAIEDELFGRLLALGAQVRVVPYGALVRSVLTDSAATQPQVGGLRRLTAMLRQSVIVTVELGDEPETPTDVNHQVPGAAPAAPTERVIIDSVEEQLILTVLRGREVDEVRRVSAVDPLTELQRTAGAARLQNYTVYLSDRDLFAELQTHGYSCVLLPAPEPLIGARGFDAAEPLRFRTAAEVATERQRLQRRQRTATLAVAAAALLLVLGYAGASLLSLSNAEARKALRQAEKEAALAKVTRLFHERYPAIARSNSVGLYRELFDLLISLPPQVQLVSIEKTADLLTLVVERRPDAAPFTRADLESALSVSTLFSAMNIREEYQGHVVRFILTAPRPKPSVTFPF